MAEARTVQAAADGEDIADHFTRDNIIKLNLEAYLPYICDCVKATDLLVHLPYYTKEQRKKIHATFVRNNSEAVKIALDILLHQCEDPGRFVAFKETMDMENGYPKISRMLNGEHVASDEHYRRLIDFFTGEIIRRVEPVELLPRLLSYGTLHSTDAELVRAEEINHGQTRACWELLFHLPCRAEGWFKDFMNTLIDCKYDDVATILEPDLYEKLVIQRKAKLPTIQDNMALVQHDYTTMQARPCDYVSQCEEETLLCDTPGGGTYSGAGDIATDEKSQDEKVVVVHNTTQLDIDAVRSTSNMEPESEQGSLDEMLASLQLHKDVGRDQDTAVENDKLSRPDKEPEPSLDFSNLARADSPDSITLVKATNRQNEQEKHGMEDLDDNNGDILNQDHTTEHAHHAEQSGSERIVYDRDYLLSFRHSPLTNYCPREINQYPDIRIYKREMKRMVFNDDEAEQIMPLEIKLNNAMELSKHNNSAGTDGSADLCFDSLLLEDNTQPVGGAVGGVEATVVPERLLNINIDMNSDSDSDSIVIESDEEEVPWNIPTDLDEVVDGAVDAEMHGLYEYQKELAEIGCTGENVIVMAPTNSGKTRVACRIMQAHMRRVKATSEIGRVAFLVENEALAIQQGEECAKHLPAYRTKVFSGTVQRDKKQYLWDFMDRRDIFVITAQVLVNALRNNEIDSLAKFTMLIFDECHHTNNLHRFNELMSKYMDLKLVDRLDVSALPQIVGLTASLGVGGKRDLYRALDHMKSLLANHDAKALCTVRRNKQELEQHTNCPTEERVAVKPRVADRFLVAIRCIKDQIEKYMREHDSMQNLPDCDNKILDGCCVPASFGTEPFRQWLSGFREAIAKVQRDDVGRMLNPCREYLEAYSTALMIHEDTSIEEALLVLHKFMRQRKQVQHDTDIFLKGLYEDFLQMSFEGEEENPKLLKLQEIILAELGNDENTRGIIFVRTKALASALISWMKKMEPLKFLKATKFVSQTASASNGGMTKRLQKDVLQYFKGGRHKLIVATSVAEEGLDITTCNLVIRYEHVTNEIVRLQSRGRARAEHSKYYVISREGSSILAKEETNAMLERLMYQIVLHLQAHIENHQNLWEQEILRIQQANKDLELSRRRQIEENMEFEPVAIQCSNCRTLICMSDDIRVIQGSHHVIINEECQDKLFSIRSPFPAFEELELQFDGAIFCSDAECKQNLGGVCEYKYTEFPLIGIKKIRVVSRKNPLGRVYKKWKEAEFYMQDFTLDDLAEIVEKRQADMNN